MMHRNLFCQKLFPKIIIQRFGKGVGGRGLATDTAPTTVKIQGVA